MLKIFLAIALAMACALGGGHKGTVNHPTTQTSRDSTGVGDSGGGDGGHIPPGGH